MLLLLIGGKMNWRFIGNICNNYYDKISRGIKKIKKEKIFFQ